MAYYNTYRDQLATLYHGHALWVPDPSELYDRVRVGDIGYVKQGHFLRMFNALLPPDDGAQEYGVPEGFVPLSMGPFRNIRRLNLFQGDYCSNTVTVDHNDRYQAAGPDEDRVASFRCRNDKGAFLLLPLDGVREDAIRTKAFETYIRKHCDSWLEFALANDIDVRLEDMIFVTGCDLTASWAMAVFVNSLDPEISLNVRVSEAESVRFRWIPTNQPHHNEPNQNVVKSHCVFIRGFRAKRILPFFKTLKAAAEHRPDNPDNKPESLFELLREPTVPDYRDPLIGILDYIAKQRPNQEIAIAHEDNLKMIQLEGVDVLTADAVENFLHGKDFPLQTKEGVALLDGGDKGVPEDEKMTFRARAGVGDEALPLVVHPILMKYLKFDISQPPDHDFGLPTEEYLSSAVHPPVHLLILENEQGPQQNIEVPASDMGSEIGVTVEDVLKTISVYLRETSGQREWAALNEGTRREVEGPFEDQMRTEERSGLRQIDYLRNRNRLQIFPRYPLPELENDDGIFQPLRSSGLSPSNILSASHTTHVVSSATSSFYGLSQHSFGSGGLPPLPHIRDRRLLTQIFTPRGLAKSPLRFDSSNDPSSDNEQLVHLGDPVFSLVVTDLIRDLFPNLSVGPSSKVRDRLKHTATLARIAVLYRLHDRILVQTGQANEVKASQNTQAEVFKAYVGGLYREQGMGPVNDWLRSLFQLYVSDAYETIRREDLEPVQAPHTPTFRSDLDVA